jgi:tetratricopeptide (TPR) repeat protein
MESPADAGGMDLSHAIPLAKEWPEGAEFARQNLSKSLIEEHALHVLARSLATGRLVAFAGAGISMAYGRMTWGQLLDTLFDLQEHEAATINEKRQSEGRSPAELEKARFNLMRWQRLKAGLWPGGASDFQTNKSTYNYTITTQLFDEFWLEHAKLKGTVSSMVDSAWGRFQQIYQAFASLTPGWEKPELGAPQREAFDKIWIAHMVAVDSSGPGFIRHLLSLFTEPSTRVARTQKLSKADGQQAHLKAYAEVYAGAYASFLAEDASPVKSLVADWGIRRLLTTNYDQEIERGMQVFKYAVKGPRALRPVPGAADEHGTLHDAQLSTQTLSRDGTGQAMCFAVEGPRRHGHVLHLHGDCMHPESLVVTEADYQRLYVDKHDKLDLVQNAVSAAFAANPILFVGSNVQEDDILRPLRQFVTGPAHQRDRMAVALLPAVKGVQYNRYMTLELYLRYGIHTIHYGMVDVEGPSGNVSHAWLNEAMLVLDAIDKVARGLVDRGKPKAGDTKPDRAALKSWRQKEWSTWAEGLTKRQDTLRELADVLDRAQAEREVGKEKLQTLLALLQDVHDANEAFCTQVQDLKPARVARAAALRLIVEELRTQITTHFFCHKLMSLHEQANDLQRQQMALPRTLDRNLVIGGEQVKAQGKAGWDVVHRNRIASAGKESPAFEALLTDVRGHLAPKKKGQQRTLLITGARGTGLGALFDSLGDRGCALKLAEALGGYNTGATSRDPVVHMNLAFSDEVSSMVQHVVSTIASRLLNAEAERAAPDDLIERLAWSLDELKMNARSRCLVMIGNAGVLFDEDGKAKNGLVGRVWQLLDEPAYLDAPIDFVLVCQEQQVPIKYRRSADQVRDLALRPVEAVCPGSRERERRLVRLNIGLLPEQTESVILHPLIEPRLEHVGLEMLGRDAAQSFQREGELLDMLRKDELGEEAARDRLERLIPHRFALTLVLGQAFALRHSKESGQVCLDRVLQRVWTGSKEMVAERAIEAVLDNWYRAHLRQDALTEPFVPAFIQNAWQVDQLMAGGLPPYRFCPAGWTAISEVLWHLSMFSRPVEAEVLLACPQVIEALAQLHAPAQPLPDPGASLTHLLRRMESWCLIYRVKPRTYHHALSGVGSDRYTVHRQMQKYHLRLCGGRNVEAGRWDNFATTLYASQPDDLPALPLATHRKLVNVVKRLARYPDPAFGQDLQTECAPFLAKGASVRTEGDKQALLDLRLYRLRGAYFLIRSNFSLGVIAHMADADVSDPASIGLMEEYRRLVRWVAREARRWEEDVAHMAAPVDSHVRRAVFFPGELVWLLNECGVIALAQGKLDEADTLLGQAEQAARRIESDDSGSIHIRIRLHSALVQIERGRPARARAILTPIAARVNGHDVPPLIAEYYLGLIEHLGGNYRQAETHYKRAVDGLRKVGRSRALAFVLQAQADLHEVMHEDQRDAADVLATEAISLAQQGGHEDVRVIAMMTQARLKIDSKKTHGDKLFAELTFAERYASRMDMPRIACEVQVTIARLLLSQGETRMSAARASAALEIAALYDLKLMKARALLTLAKIYHLRGDLVGARSLARLGKELAVSADYYSCVRGFRELELQLEGVASVASDRRESA